MPHSANADMHFISIHVHSMYAKTGYGKATWNIGFLDEATPGLTSISNSEMKQSLATHGKNLHFSPLPHE